MMWVALTAIVVCPLATFCGVLLGYRIGKGEWPWRK